MTKQWHYSVDMEGLRMSGSGSIPCGICREYFMDTEMLRKHLRNHVSENPLPDDMTMDGLGISASGPFPCGICREDFLDIEMFKKHIRAHVPEDYK